jgi:GNAT superfamily N-acetyltransferase
LVALAHHAGDGQAEDRLGGVDGVAAGQRDAGFGAHGAAAANHFAGHFRRQHVDRPAEDGDGHQRVAAHGVDVADGVGGGDAAEVEGIVDDGHEEVGGRDHAAFVVQGVHGGVVARGVADPQLRVQGLGAALGEDHIQHLGEILQPQPAPWLYWVRRIGSLIRTSAQIVARL